MQTKIFSLVYPMCLLILVTGCNKKESAEITGAVTFVVGKAELHTPAVKKTVKVGDSFSQGDMIKTGKDGVVVATIGQDDAIIEIQNDSEFKVAEYSDKNKNLDLQKGNLWLKVKKLNKGANFSLKSATSVAAVRGTKFFTFQLGDIFGTCVCEGQVEMDLKNPVKNKEKEQNRDYLIISRGNKTVILKPEDLKFMGTVGKDHQHSMLDNSPVGKKAQFTPEAMKKFAEFLNSKLDQVK